MSGDKEPTVDLVESLQNLAVKDADEESKDDGYSSSSSDNGINNLSEKVKGLDLGEGTTEDTTPTTDEPAEGHVKEGEAGEESDDDEKVLQPLCIVQDKEEYPKVEISSRGPVSGPDHRSRFAPYQRPAGLPERPDHLAGMCAPVLVDKDDETRPQPLPNLLIPTRSSTEPDNLTKIDPKVEWTDQHELAISKYVLPDDTIFAQNGGTQVKMCVQLDPNVRDMKSFLAEVKSAGGQDAEKKSIGPIVISIKQDLMDSQEKFLLAELKNEDCIAAKDLVYNKDISSLVNVIGDRQDTVLAILCAKGKSNPGPVNAQIYYLVQRLLSSPDPKHAENVFQLNTSGISAFEIACITNNSLVACFLAEVMYNLSEDTRSGLQTLNSKDHKESSIIHLLARKGDSNVETLRRLLAMRLTDNTRVFSLACNSKKQNPLHIAVQSTNQPETIAILNQAIKNGFEAQDVDGMTPLHYAAQRSTDPALIQTILSYKKDNINNPRRDGKTPLDILNSRPVAQSGDSNNNHKYVIDIKAKAEMVKLLQDNGAKFSVEDQRSPMMSGMDGSLNTPNSSPHSPVGSPYSSNASPRTLPDDCPSNIYTNMHVAGSVESYVQSSPESEHCDYTITGNSTNNYTYMPDMLGNRPNNFNNGFYNNGAPVGMMTGGAADLEDQIASQLLNEFPEIRSYVGQIIDGNY